MALKPCKECGNPISKSAKACPQCGYKKKKTSVFTWLVLVIFLSIMYSVLSTNSPPAPLTRQTSKPLPSAEEIAESKRRAGVSVAASTIKTALRDPKSIEWLETYSDNDGTLVCIQYRAKNGFGGMAINKSAVFFGVISDWDKHCVGKKLHNMGYTNR